MCADIKLKEKRIVVDLKKQSTCKRFTTCQIHFFHSHTPPFEDEDSGTLLTVNPPFS